MLIAFIQNAALLITLSAMYGLIKWYRVNNRFYNHIIQGAWFGFIAIAAMMMPFHYVSGTIYDGRSVILTLAGFWGGGLTTAVTTLMALTYRAFIGGIGVWAGMATILFCGITGLFFRYHFKDKLEKLKFHHLYITGITSHLVMLACQMLIPGATRGQVLTVIWFPVLLIFPVTFAFISKIFQIIDSYIQREHRIRDAESLYRTTLLSIGDSVICTDKQGQITQMNAVAEELTEWKLSEAKGLKLDNIFTIISEESRERVESPFARVMSSHTIISLANHTLLISKSGKEIPIADSGAPIINEEGEITGVVLVFRDQTEEREYQNRLIQSEAMYREREFWLTESQKAGRIGSYDFDIEADHWSSSGVLDEIFGITMDNPRTLVSWNAIIHPDHQKEMLDYFLTQVIKNNQTFDKEYKIVRQIDGAERWVLGRGELIFDKDGAPVRMYGTIIDITERKLFGQQLQESEERFRKAVLLAPIPIMVHDEEGMIINISEGWTHFSGYSQEEIPDIKTWTNKAYGARAIEVEKYVNGLFSSDITVFSGEYEVLTKTGDIRIWNFYETPLGKLSNGKKIMLSLAPDVTQRVKVKKELEESERAYRYLFENHSAVKFLSDPDNGQIVRANQAAADFYGWNIEKLQSMNIGEINILPQKKIRKGLENALFKNKEYFEFKHRIANGQVRDVEVYSSLTEYGGKELLHSIVHDVTEKKRLFDELVIAKEDAEESDRLKTAFLSNMSHEIRTPLNGIIGFANLLAEDDNLSKDDKRNFVAILNKSAENLLKIINDILDISRLDTGKTVIEEKPFDAGALLLTLQTLFKKRMEDSGKTSINLTILKPEGKIVLNTDESRLMQVFSNLIDNAIRFTSIGSITFGISEIKENRAEFFVKDTGIGIPKEKHELIFDRFTQADDSFTRSYGGTGLGLAIVKKLLELMGSSIVLESVPGEGTSFRFTLPVLAESENSSDLNGPKTVEIIKNRKMKILVVEDDNASWQYFKLVLANHCEELLFAETGKDALQIYEDNRPDVILMDIRLPDQNGLDVVRKIRESDQNVVIIAQTAYAMNTDKLTALATGCNDYISKPINAEMLLGIISQFNN
jgi:PAS domain S-box-containing protein